MAVNKLTPGEIRSVVEKIRKKYNTYAQRYRRHRAVCDAFEERYVGALRSGVDISTFLMAEISAIDELLKREEDREAAEVKKPTVVAKKDHADKVVEENLKRIEKYPDFPLHKDASAEVRRLLGALDSIEREHWRTITVALRNTAYSIDSSEMLTLDSRLRSLAYPDKEGIPPFLVSYVGQLRRFPRNYAAMERQEKEFILEAAFFLNDLLGILERVKKVYQDLGAAEKKALENGLALVSGIITDFRLKEFRRKGREA